MSEFFEFLGGIKDYVLPTLATILAWNKDAIKRKVGLKAEEKNIESVTITNLEKIIATLQKNLDIYQEMVEDLDTKYKSEIQQIRLELEEARNKLNEYREQYGEL